ncbi:MAG: hypothetical protein AB8G96_09255 [Phycisphaerales bacterium]
MATLASGSAAPDPTGIAESEPSRPDPKTPGLIGWVLDLFSSIRLGIVLMILIFVYSSIGSAGLPVHPNILAPSSWMNVRELIEMSEFRWFHWWPFDVLIGLFCLNLTVATIRRIPFNILTLGVWTIHTGLIILSLGSVYYFTMKKEGDVPVPRREVQIAIPGVEPQTMVATPGNSLILGNGADQRRFRIARITPDWELLSGDDAGTRAYKVTVSVEGGPEGMFMRELIDGFPQYTEDLIRSEDPQQPFARAKNVRGAPLVDETVELSLAPVSVDHFYLMESRALYVRARGAETWSERPVPWMPLFKDHLRDYEGLWLGPNQDRPPLRPLEVVVASEADDDPLPNVDFVIDEYLRYASLQKQLLPGGARLNPVARIRLESQQSATQQTFDMEAFNASTRTQMRGALVFDWVEDDAAFARLAEAVPPAIEVRPPGGEPVRVPINRTAQADPDLEFSPVAGTDYAWRVLSFDDGLQIANRTLSVAVIEVTQGDRQFTRWVFDDPSMTRDVPEGETLAANAAGAFDATLDLSYIPGTPVAIRLIAGPDEEQLRVSVPQIGTNAPPQIFDLRVGQPVLIPGGLTLHVDAFTARGQDVVRPAVVPERMRDRDVGMMASMVRVQIPGAVSAITGSDPVESVDGSMWLPFHRYPFDAPHEAIRRFRYTPTVVTMEDGSQIEVMFSRQRHPLTHPVRLDRFEIDSRIGGFSGDTSSIRDWRSIVRFEEDGQWSESREVHVNNPKPSGGYWFFQAQWDPPDEPRFEGDPGSAGLNYTVLGVGNRNGVVIQLWGCIITVIGMMYAFYVKPWIKRRRQAAVYADMAARGILPAGAVNVAGGDSPAEPELAPAGSEVQR